MERISSEEIRYMGRVGDIRGGAKRYLPHRGSAWQASTLASGANPIVSMLMLTTTGGDLVGVRRCRSNYTTSLWGVGGCIA